MQRARHKVDRVHKECFSLAKSVVVDSGSITIPHTCGREQNRDNTPADTLQQYYQRSITITFLDHMLTQFHEMYSEGHQKIIIDLSSDDKKRS